ncbi:proline-rich protein 14 isoform X2 [Spea bombifrons]|uniref:proline-rich protein 14 isoform X2 n=1 Tax=Spea bombifrons TaxID=233779 RepID=UPI00234BA053|nr:proline-rich protein 14 isoform X2 [Spea bombifrons]
MRSEAIDSERQHRRRMLVYRPSPDNLPAAQRAEPETQPGTYPTGTPGRRERRAGRRRHLPSSPLERRHKKVLTVALTDISKEVEIRHAKSNLNDRPSTSEDSAENSEPAPKKRDRPDSSFHLAPPSILPSHAVTTPLAALSPPPYPSEAPSSPPKLQSWSLVPILHSVRSKLESFADIFLSPIKCRSGWRTEQSSLAGPGGAEPRSEAEEGGELNRAGEKAAQAVEESQEEMDDCVRTSLRHSVDRTQTELAASTLCLVTQPPTNDKQGLCQPSPEELQHGTDGRGMRESSTSDRTSLTTTKPRTGMKIELKIAVSALGRPPLERRFSCPSRLLSPVRVTPCSPPAGPGDAGESGNLVLLPRRASYPYRRRHSLGAADERKAMSLSAFSFTCLRKEKHPFLLCHSGGPGTYQPVDNGRTNHQPVGQVSCQSPSVARNGLRHQFLPTQTHLGGGRQLEDSSLSSSETKGKENATICGKVSNFQIRKRPTRHEGNLTPLGLPKRARTFETIFEEPVMRGGNLILTSQRPLRRLIVFRDSGVHPRRQRKKGRGGGRGRRGDPSNTAKSRDLELLLENKLTQLDAALRGAEAAETDLSGCF